jgi:hypothetical protein
MSVYRLLRSNKETGPFSADELVANGFKPYDLLWVEGKSAGWRYVSELPEFAHLAPMVEEQPYDRFYKKGKTTVSEKASVAVATEELPTFSNASATTFSPGYFQPQSTENNIIITAPAVAITEDIPPPTPHFATVAEEIPLPVTEVNLPANPAVNQNPVITVPRKVHVVFPSGSRNNVMATPDAVVPVANVKAEPAYYSSPAPVNNEQPIATVTSSAAPAFSPISHYSNHFTQEEILSSLARRNQSNSWMMIAAFVLGIGTLLGLGLMIGLNFSNNGASDNASNAIVNKNNGAPLPSSSATRPASKNEETEPVAYPADVTETSKTVEYVDRKADTRKALPSASNNAGLPLPANNHSSGKQVSKLSATAEKNGSSRRENEDNPESASNAQNLIEVTTNTYSVGAFGGISNLQCILVNKSSVSFETVEVVVEYLQANKKIYKKEVIYFKDVRAGQQLVINAPKSSRGIKVVSKIVKVTSSPAFTTIKS